MDECLRLIPVKVSIVEQDSLNKGLSIEEIDAAIDSLSSGKSPGIDGLPVEFYKKQKNWITVEILRLYEEEFAKGSLGKDINKGVIKLLPKTRDKILIKNWRPITLLNLSYKILAKALARRITPLVSRFISQTQTRFIQGRYILENLITSWEAMHWAKENGQEVAMILLDFEKAYDRIEWCFFIGMLKAFGFTKKYSD